MARGVRAEAVDVPGEGRPHDARPSIACSDHRGAPESEGERRSWLNVAAQHVIGKEIGTNAHREPLVRPPTRYIAQCAGRLRVQVVRCWISNTRRNRLQPSSSESWSINS